MKTFNGKEIYNDKNLMCYLKISKYSSKALKNLVKELEAYSKTIAHREMMQDLHDLLSQPSRVEQLIYGDFDEDLIKLILARELKHYSAILAFIDGTCINIQGQGRADIPKGYLLIFKYSIMHSSRSYDKKTTGSFLRLAMRQKNFLITKVEICSWSTIILSIAHSS